MTEKICCVFNIAPHYRGPIYSLMDQKLNCDFYIGDSLGKQIKPMDYKSLNGFQKVLENRRLTSSGFMWQIGVWKLIFKPYKHYIITGSPSMLSNWVLCILAKFTRKKIYAWTHGLKKPVKSKGDFFQKCFYKLCHKILLYGESAKDVMLKEGFKKKSLVPIYNSLDHERHLQIRENLKTNDIFYRHFKNNDPIIIYVGRIQKAKKLDMIVQALDKLRTANMQCNLVLVGAQVDENTIEKLVEECDLTENVWFYGPSYDDEEIGNLFYNANVCVSPGPVGLTAIHSLTFGCPVITNNDFENQMPEYEAVKQGETGDFFVEGNIDSLCTTIGKWISLDEKQKEIVRSSAMRSIDEKWNPGNQIKIFEKLLN